MQTTCPWWGRGLRLATALSLTSLTFSRSWLRSEPRASASGFAVEPSLLADRDLVPAGGARPIVRAADRVVAAGSSRRDGQIDLVESGADQAGEGDGRRIAPDAAHRKRLEHSGLA